MSRRAGRTAIDVLVFGGFAIVAFAYRTGPRSVLMMFLAGAGLAFARGPVSRGIAIASFLICWFYSPFVGALSLGVAWFVRSSIDTGRRMRAKSPTSQVAGPETEPSSAAPPPTSPPAPDEVIDQLTQHAGDEWPHLAIDHADAEVRRRAVREMREGDKDRNAGILAKRLEAEPVDELRLDITLALRALRRPAAVEALANSATTKHQWWFVQKHAVRALAEIGDARAVPRLVEALGRGDALLEGEILAALPAFGAAARPALEERLRHPRAAVRARCAEGLARLGFAESAPAIAPLLDAREPGVRQAAAAALGQLQATVFAPALLVRLDEPSWEVRAKAARALGDLGFREALPRLIARTEDAHDEVARAAAESLAAFRDPAAIPALVQLFQGEWLRVEAGAAILAIGDGDSVDLLRPLLRLDDVPLVLATLDVLATLGDSRVTPDVIELVGREDIDIRVSALEAIGRLGNADACPVVAGCLADPDARVRAAAVLAAGRIGCAVDLGQAFGDPEPGVRSAACEALKATPPPSEVLMPLLSDFSEDVRWRAAALVQADATPAVIGSLAALLNDPEPQVVREAAKALRRVGVEGARTILAGLSRLDWYARRYCVEELSTWDDAVPLLIEASRGPEALVRWCAVEALLHMDESAASAALATLRGEESDARVRELLNGSAL